MDTNNLIESIDARGCFRRSHATSLFLSLSLTLSYTYSLSLSLPLSVASSLFLLFIQIPLICLVDAFDSVCDVISQRGRG